LAYFTAKGYCTWSRQKLLPAIAFSTFSGFSVKGLTLGALAQLTSINEIINAATPASIRE
jgi:hypothetical protein